MAEDTPAIPPIGVWGAALRSIPTSEGQDIAAELEGLGYGVMWFPEADGRDVFVQIALLLAATDRLIGGTAIASIWSRDALAMSCAARSILEPFPDRLLLGLGASHHLIVENLRGHHYERPLTTMREYLDAMDRASYSAYPPATPIRRFLAALGPRMLALAGERSDGVVPYLVPPEHTAIARAALPVDALVCPVQAVVLDPDPGRAREIARRNHVSYYMPFPNYTNNLRRLGFDDDDFTSGGSDRLVDAVVACGPVERASDRVRAHFDAGADHVVVQVISDATEPPREVWRELAPALAGLARSVAPTS